YMDWQDIQQNLSFQYHGVPTTAFVNGTSASGVGVDFGATAELVRNLTVGLNFGWNNLQMDSTTISQGAVLFAKGDRPNMSPEYTAGASVEYGFPVNGTGFNARLSASGNYISEQVSRTIVAGQSVFAKGDPMFTARASAQLSAPDHWTLALFVDNAT